jgi:HSP20 family molecular chaperone IbpA
VRTEPRHTEPEGARYFQREYVPEAMSRVFDFPVEIDTENVRATLDRGMLRIRVPKAAAGRRRIIRVAPSS